MSRILQALAWVAPKAALERAHAVALLSAKREYDGARRDRRAGGWHAKGSSANVELGPAIKLLRHRSRELVRNTSIGARLIDVLVAHIIGTGVLCVPQSGSDRLDKLLSEMFAEWAEYSDVEGELDFAGQQMMALRSMLEGGDSITRFVDQPLDGSRGLPMRLQVLEGDHLDESRDGGVLGTDARLGVILGEWGVRKGYWLFKRHPGEMITIPAAQDLQMSVPVDRSEAVHLYRPLRPGMVRGVPVMSPIMLDARDFSDVREAMVLRLKTEACFSAFVRGTDSQPKMGQAKTDAVTGQRIEEVRPGMIHYMQPGEEVTFATPAGSGAFEPVAMQALMGMAAGGMITYDQLTGDLRQANYSSLRAGKIEFRRMVEQLQHLVFVPMFLRRITSRFLDRAVLAGRITERQRDRAKFDYTMPGVEPIDPLKDLQADILAVRSGRFSPQEFIEAWGKPWRQVLQEHEAFWKEADASPSGLVFDIDPRRVSQLGVMQTDTSEQEPAASKAASKQKKDANAA